MFTVLPAGQPTMGIDNASLNFGALNSGSGFTSQTPAQAVNITQTGTQNTVTWTAASDSPWLTVSPASGSGPAELSIGVHYVSTLPPAGSASVTGAITVTYTGSATATSTVSARLNLPAAATAPTGLIDTPAAGAKGLQGSIAVTGWAVDEIMVDRVEVWRDLQPGEPTPPFFAKEPSDPRNGKVFVGNATLVNGARSDIEALNPTMPLNSRGGWGYLLLTWGLWNQGNGTYTLYAFAFNAEGQVSTLGQKTIGIANATADKPFGAIDTPAIGGTVSGTVLVNFGWALTPNRGGTTCKVPATGVQVSIDSGPLQPVAFGDARSDIAGMFAGFTNSAAAGGHYTFDTTALANGVHTIAMADHRRLQPRRRHRQPVLHGAEQQCGRGPRRRGRDSRGRGRGARGDLGRRRRFSRAGGRRARVRRAGRDGVPGFDGPAHRLSQAGRADRCAAAERLRRSLAGCAG